MTTVCAGQAQGNQDKTLSPEQIRQQIEVNERAIECEEDLDEEKQKTAILKERLAVQEQINSNLTQIIEKQSLVIVNQEKIISNQTEELANEKKKVKLAEDELKKEKRKGFLFKLKTVGVAVAAIAVMAIAAN